MIGSRVTPHDRSKEVWTFVRDDYTVNCRENMAAINLIPPEERVRVGDALVKSFFEAFGIPDTPKPRQAGNTQQEG
jgi:hypothetical protein